MALRIEFARPIAPTSLIGNQWVQPHIPISPGAQPTPPKFAFLSAEDANLENPLHLYYRWRTFAFAQGDSQEQWRTEQLQIYEKGAIWQPPPCERRDVVTEDEMPSPVVARISKSLLPFYQ